MARQKVRLSDELRRQLEEVVKRTDDARVLRRAQALLWLDEGESIISVARRLMVSKATISRWRQRVQQNPGPVQTLLCDRPRSGRPPHKSRAVVQCLREVMGVDPRRWGYSSPVWTAPLLRQHIKQHQGVEVHERTIRRCLRKLGYRYKRPRYRLSRRSRFWRQAKGGSRRGLGGGSARSSSSLMPPSSPRRHRYGLLGRSWGPRLRFPSQGRETRGCCGVR